MVRKVNIALRERERVRSVLGGMDEAECEAENENEV